MRAADMAGLYKRYPTCANGDGNPAAVVRISGRHTVRICTECAVRLDRRTARKEAAR